MYNFTFHVTAILGTLSLYMVPISAGSTPAPYNFNVYTSGNIGTSANPYGADFEGLVGSGGSAYFSNFSANANGPAYMYSVYSGGSFSMTSGSTSNGGIEAAGNITVNSATIAGNVHGGGNLSGANGTITGNASLAGINTSSLTINGTVTTNQPFVPSLNLPSVTTYFQNASSYWGGLAPTATFNPATGQVSTLSSGRNIVDLSLSQLSGVTSIVLNGPSNAFVIFDISTATPTAQTLNDVTFNLSGGLTSSDILFNLTNATQLTLTGGYLSVLAPEASITFTSGVVTGNLVAQNLYGAGQANTGTFTGFQLDQNNFNIQAPEPSTYALLFGFLGVVLLIGRNKRVLV
jgi:choice-of-anchor A domain-containing protein